MARKDEPTATYGSAAGVGTGTYGPKLSETYAYSDLRETEFRSKTHGLGLGDRIRLHEQDYAITGIISEGTGEAVIYKIEDDRRQTFALKLYFEFGNPKEEPGAETLKRIREITDPDILKLHDFGAGADKYQGKYCFEVSDYAEGGDLFSVADLKAKYDPDFIARTIVPEIFNGIKKLHGYKVYHCDLKPWNIFYLDRDQTDIVIGDYGSAKAFDLETEKDARKTSIVKGTETYLAPEQSRGIISEKNDYYSLGIILLHLLYPGSIANDSNPRQVSREKFARIVERQFSSLPIIDYDAAHRRLNRLIEGLTLVNHANRWGRDEVEKWLKGEEVEVKYKAVVTDSVQPVKLGYATIRTGEDFVKVLETSPSGYDDLIEDYDTFTTVKVWLDSYRDIPTRRAFDHMVRFYHPLGKEYVNEALLRFFDPARPVTIDMHSFNFFTSEDVRKDVEAFVAKLDEVWKITSPERLRFYLFQLEFSLRQVGAFPDNQNSSAISALVEKLHSVFGLTSTPFDNFTAQVPAVIKPDDKSETYGQLLNLFYAFNPDRTFTDLNNRPVNTLAELGLFFARDESAFTDEFLEAEKRRFLEKIGRAKLDRIGYVPFVFAALKQQTTTELELESLTFDKQRNYQVRYRFYKSLNPYLPQKGIEKDFTIRSGRSETYKQRRRLMQSFSAVFEEFLETVTQKQGLATLTADNVALVRSRFIRESWKRYLSLYKKEITRTIYVAAALIAVGVLTYGIKEHKLHVDRVLGISWMDNDAYQKKYREEYTKAQIKARERYSESFRNALTFQQIRFFSAGKDAPPPNRRVYQTQFDAKVTRFIYVQVEFAHARPGERVDLLIQYRLLRDNGKKVAEVSQNSYVDTDWENSWHYMSFGADRVRNWEKGNYTVEVRVNDRFIGSKSFTVN